MCRFTFYLGGPISLSSLITEPEHSLIRQSSGAREREEPLNGDGFGVAWYAPGHDIPGRFRSVNPAWSNSNLVDLARVTTSTCVLAHVRAATQSLGVNENNCHPFKRGRFAFMHNGDIGGFARVRRPLLSRLSDEGFSSIHGSTDSEHLFAVAMEHLDGRAAEASCQVLADVLETAMAEVIELMHRHAPGEHAYLNLVLTDGQSAASCRFSTDPDYADSLYINAGHRYVCEDGVCRMLEPRELSSRAVLIASEPLSVDRGWEAVPFNHMVLIAPDLEVTTRRVQI